MNAAGSDGNKSPTLAGIDGDRSWSPDGDLLVFDRDHPS